MLISSRRPPEKPATFTATSITRVGLGRRRRRLSLFPCRFIIGLVILNRIDYFTSICHRFRCHFLRPIIRLARLFRPFGVVEDEIIIVLVFTIRRRMSIFKASQTACWFLFNVVSVFFARCFALTAFTCATTATSSGTTTAAWWLFWVFFTITFIYNLLDFYITIN